MSLPEYNKGYTPIPYVPCRIGRTAGGVMNTNIALEHADMDDWRYRCADARAQKTTKYIFSDDRQYPRLPPMETKAELDQHNRAARREIAVAETATAPSTPRIRRPLPEFEKERARSYAKGKEIQSRQRELARLRNEEIEFAASRGGAQKAKGKGKEKAKRSRSKSVTGTRRKQPIRAKPTALAKENKAGALAKARDGTWYKNVREKTGGLRWRPLSVADKIKYHSFIKGVKAHKK